MVFSLNSLNTDIKAYVAVETTYVLKKNFIAFFIIKGMRDPAQTQFRQLNYQQTVGYTETIEEQ